MLVSQLLKSKGEAVFTASPHETLQGAATMLHARRVGAMVVTENDKVTRGLGRYAGTGCKTDFDLPPILQVLITLGLTGMCTSVRPWTMMDEVTLCQEPASGLRSILRSSLAIWTCIMEAVQHA